jgi:hypothetical protein
MSDPVMSFVVRGNFCFRDDAVRQAFATHKVDANELFRARAAALGWMAPTDSDHDPTDLWRLRDAGIFEEFTDGICATFEVGRSGVGSDGVALLSFMACASDVIELLGRLEPRRLQLTVPYELISSASPVAPTGRELANVIQRSALWFAFSDEEPRVRFRASLRPVGATDGQITPMRQWLIDIARSERFAHVWRFSDQGRGPRTDAQTLTFAGALVERSLPAAGWLLALLADGAHRSNVERPAEIELTFI